MTGLGELIMNIDNTILSSLPPSNSAAGTPLPSITGNDGFSGALVAQISLLTNINNEVSFAPQPQDTTGKLLPAGVLDTQNLATQVGNDLPSTGQINENINRNRFTICPT